MPTDKTAPTPDKVRPELTVSPSPARPAKMERLSLVREASPAEMVTRLLDLRGRLVHRGNQSSALRALLGLPPLAK